MTALPALPPAEPTATALAPKGLGPRFRTLWAASAASNLGDGFGLAAAPLLAAALTRDPALVAGISVALGLPWLLFSAVGGVLIDRLDRRAVMAATSAFRAVLFLLLAVAVWGGWASLPLLYIVLFLFGTAEMMFDNASFAILPSVVGKSKLEAANGRLFVTHRVTNEFVGPPVGSYAFAFLTALPFVGQALAFAVAALLFRSLPGDFRPRHDTEASLRAVWTDMAEGFRWFWAHRIIRNLGIAIGVINFACTGAFSIFVLFAQDILGIDEARYGLLLTAGAVGGVAGGLLAGPVNRWIGAGGIVIGGHLVIAAMMAVVAMSQSVLVVAGCFVAFAFFAINSQVVVISFRQAVIPDRLLGRITSVFRLIAVGCAPLGALAGGFAARQWGLTAPFWIAAVLTLAATLALVPSVTNRAMAAARAAGETA